MNFEEDPTSFVKKKRLKKFRKERADRGWGEEDFWCFHSYHSWMMISVLERFKTGAPDFPWTRTLKTSMTGGRYWTR